MGRPKPIDLQDHRVERETVKEKEKRKRIYPGMVGIEDYTCLVHLKN